MADTNGPNNSPVPPNGRPGSDPGAPAPLPDGSRRPSGPPPPGTAPGGPAVPMYPPAQQPGYPPTPPPGSYPPAADYGYPSAPISGGYGATPTQVDPGKTLGIVGFILAFVFQIAGLVVSIIAFLQSKRAGYKNQFALAGIIVSAVLMVLGVIVAIIAFAIFATAFRNGVPYYGN